MKTMPTKSCPFNRKTQNRWSPSADGRTRRESCFLSFWLIKCLQAFVLCSCRGAMLDVTWRHFRARLTWVVARADKDTVQGKSPLSMMHACISLSFCFPLSIFLSYSLLLAHLYLLDWKDRQCHTAPKAFFCLCVTHFKNQCAHRLIDGVRAFWLSCSSPSIAFYKSLFSTLSLSVAGWNMFPRTYSLKSKWEISAASNNYWCRITCKLWIRYPPKLLNS